MNFNRASRREDTGSTNSQRRQQQPSGAERSFREGHRLPHDLPIDFHRICASVDTEKEMNGLLRRLRSAVRLQG